MRAPATRQHRADAEGSARPAAPALFTVAYPELSAGDQGIVETLRARHDPTGSRLIRAHFTLVFAVAGLGVDEVTQAGVNP